MYAEPHKNVIVKTEDLLHIYGYPSSTAVVDRELDALRERGLISVGYNVENPLSANITPTPLTLHFIARCSGSIDPISYYAGKVREVVNNGVEKVESSEGPTKKDDGAVEGEVVDGK